MHERMQTFTERAVGKREQLYEPDEDHGANYDYIVGICWAFAIAGVVILAASLGMVL